MNWNLQNTSLSRGSRMNKGQMATVLFIQDSTKSTWMRKKGCEVNIYLVLVVFVTLKKSEKPGILQRSDLWKRQGLLRHGEAVGRLTRRVYTTYSDRHAYLVFSIRIKMETGQILAKQPITNRILFTWNLLL